MKNITNASGFIEVLRNNKKMIVENFFGDANIENIIHKHSLPLIDKNINIIMQFCECFIDMIENDTSISQCHIKIEFLTLINNHNFNIQELFNFIFILKNIMIKIIFENGYLSYLIQTKLEQITLSISNELSLSYDKIQKNETNYKCEQLNLLNEYKKAVDTSNIVSKTNPKGIITYVNDKFCEISGYSRNELIGKPHNIIRHPEMQSEPFRDLWTTIKEKKVWHGIIKNLNKYCKKYIVDSTVIPIIDIDGDIIEYIAVRHDITELEETKEQLHNINKVMKNKVNELYSMTSILEKQATRDGLTNLYNRTKFEEIFDEELQKASNSNKELSMVLFDIDHFKVINDNYGHQSGDKILIELSNLVQENIKVQDTIARWGGEEFVILLPGTNVDGAVLFAEKLRKIIKLHTFSSIGKMTASFGVGKLQEYENKSTFFEKVDKALYVAKEKGRNRVEKAIFSCVY